jgi:hypothetical protein
MTNNDSWVKIFNDLKIDKHDFNKSPFYLTANQIKIHCRRTVISSRN